MQNAPIHALRGRVVDAAYRDPELPQYVGHPLIEALPPILEAPDAADAMAVLPDYNDEHRQGRNAIRLHSIETAQQFFEPLDCHIDLEGRFSRMIRGGYLGRNLAAPGYWTWVQRQIALMQKGQVPPSEEPLTSSSEQPLTSATTFPFRAMANGFYLIGMSGTGKTTGVEQVLKTYPQWIRHREYRGRPFTHNQIVWLRLSCPFDGSVRGLCNNFFQAVDDLCGTRYEQKYGGPRRTTVEMMPHLARVSACHSLGVLVIDEIQNLRGAKTPRRRSSGGGGEPTASPDGPHEMLKFFVQLINTLGLPIVLIGTYAAEGVLTGELHSMRRGCGQGAMEWKRMEADDTWWHFLESLWQYQYTRTNTTLTPDLADALFFESQGIVDFAIKTYLLAQARAITNGIEEVTVELIHSAGQDALAPAAKVLNGLRDRNGFSLRDLPDMPPVDISRFIADARANAARGALAGRRRPGPKNTGTSATTALSPASDGSPVTSSSLAAGSSVVVPAAPAAPAASPARSRPKKQDFPLDGLGRDAREFLA